MPVATVSTLPGTSIWVELKLAAFAGESAAIGVMTRETTTESIVQQEFNESVLSDFVSMMFLPLIYNLLNRHSLNSWRSEGGIAPLNDLCKGKPRWRLTTLERGARCRSQAKHTLKAVSAFRGLPGCFPAASWCTLSERAQSCVRTSLFREVRLGRFDPRLARSYHRHRDTAQLRLCHRGNCYPQNAQKSACRDLAQTLTRELRLI